MANDLGKFIGLIIGLPGTIALLLVVFALPKFTTDNAQNVANLGNYTQHVTEAIIDYVIPWWVPVVGLGVVGVVIVCVVVLVFGRDAVEW